MKSFPIKLGVILSIIGFAIFGYAEGWGADWKLYAKDSFQNLRYYDAKTITYPSKDIVRVWEKIVYSDKGIIEVVAGRGPKYKDLNESVWLEEFNCPDRKMRDLNETLYSRDGSVLLTYKYETPDWDEIEPDTLVEALYEIVCKRGGIKK